MVVSTQIRRYLTSHGCTIREFCKLANVSEAVVRKWLYSKSEPSSRMLGRLANVSGFFEKTELQDIPLLKKSPNIIEKQQGGSITLATIIAQKAETYRVKKTKNSIEIVCKFSKEAFDEPISLDFNYNDIQRAIDEQHYVLQPEDIQHIKR